MTTEQIKELRDTLAEQVDQGLKKTDVAVGELNDALKTLQDQVKDQAKENEIRVQGLDEDQAKKFQFKECFKTVKSGKNLIDMENFEGEVLRETMKAQTVDPTSAGGVFVPTVVSERVIDLALSMSVLNTLPIQRLSVEGNNRLDIPVVTQDPSTAWLGELADIPESSMTFGSVRIEPWKIASFVGASNEILAQPNANMESMVLNSMARQIGLGLDYAGLRGTGSGDDMPMGIVNDTATQKYTTEAFADWNTFDKLQEMLEATDTYVGQLAYISRPEIFRYLRRQTVAQFSGQAQGDGQPLFVPFMSQAQLEGQVGYPLKSTTQMPKIDVGTGTANGSELIFGDFSQLMLATYGNLELASDTSVNFKKYGTVMRAVQRADVKVLRGDSFVVGTNVKFSA